MDSNETFGPIQPARPGAGPSSNLPAIRSGNPERRAASFNFQVALRAITRHWWQILALWIVGTLGAAYVVQTRVVPKYNVFGLLRVDNANTDIFNTNMRGNEQLEQFLETQVKLITSPKIIADAISDKNVAKLARIRYSPDPEADLQASVKPMVVPKTTLIQVGMTSTNSEEAATIINTIIRKYLDSTNEFAGMATTNAIDKLQSYKSDLEVEKNRIATYVENLIRRGNVDIAALNNKNRGEKGEDPAVDVDAVKAARQVTVEENSRLRAQLLDVELKIIDAESRVKQAKITADEVAATSNAAAKPGSPAVSTARDKLITSRLLNDPDLRALNDIAQKDKLSLERVKGIARSKADPQRVALEAKVQASTMAFFNKLESKRNQLKAELELQPDAAKLDPEVAVREAEAELGILQQNKKGYEANLKDLIVANRADASDAFKIQMYQADMSSYKEMIDQVDRRLQQLKFDSKGEARVSLWNAAKPSPAPASDYRKRLLVASPVGVLAAVIGLFVMLEVRGGRVASAEDLVQRSRVDVLGVLPPLPGPRPSKGAKASREHGDRIEEFVQSLDHLRVTLCGEATLDQGGRCVLITSAVGGEGKTTLAVQLASRCANSGASTLLIDADLRRAALGRLLDVVDGPGLSDVLRGDIEAESALVVISQAGGFHLLPAGSAGHDPSRILQGKPLGQLLARLRKVFDIIIIDTPPVLPVPDALTIGRWADGVVLAVRRDNSRFFLVEQANNRLRSAAIPVLGAVVNGVRPSVSAYGSYAYSGRTSSEASGGAGPGVEI